MTMTCYIELGVFRTEPRFPFDMFLCTIILFLLSILSPDLCACLCTYMFSVKHCFKGFTFFRGTFETFYCVQEGV